MEITGREFEAVAAHAGPAYLRYSFTKGTAQEVGFLVDELGLGPGVRLLDVGCGPGRHCLALARLGVEVVGLDISMSFLQAAAASAGSPGRWVRSDARRLPFADASFDVALSLCQGGFGLLGGTDDGSVLAEMSRVVRPGGSVLVTAFSSYFAVHHLEETDTFDADAGVNHERATVRSPSGEEADFDLWTTCFTPRELRLLAERAGLGVRGLWSVTPGAYGRRRPGIDTPEFMLVGEV